LAGKTGRTIDAPRKNRTAFLKQTDVSKLHLFFRDFPNRKAGKPNRFLFQKKGRLFGQVQRTQLLLIPL